MANRPVRGSKSSSAKPAKPKSQSEINRIKPTGSLTLDVLETKSRIVESINVKLPDGDIYQFFHLPMTVGTSEDFISDMSESNRVKAIRIMLTDLLVNEDGTPFVSDPDDLRPVSWNILNAIFDAINKSDKEEPGED